MGYEDATDAKEDVNTDNLHSGYSISDDIKMMIMIVTLVVVVAVVIVVVP